MIDVLKPTATVVGVEAIEAIIVDINRDISRGDGKSPYQGISI
ncbi:MAG: hypothetical protein WBD31_32455 [Rubripirellula sp.]